MLRFSGLAAVLIVIPMAASGASLSQRLLKSDSNRSPAGESLVNVAIGSSSPVAIGSAAPAVPVPAAKPAVAWRVDSLDDFAKLPSRAKITISGKILKEISTWEYNDERCQIWYETTAGAPEGLYLVSGQTVEGVLQRNGAFVLDQIFLVDLREIFFKRLDKDRISIQFREKTGEPAQIEMKLAVDSKRVLSWDLYLKDARKMVKTKSGAPHVTRSNLDLLSCQSDGSAPASSGFSGI